MTRLDRQTILVTGASRGAGAGIARAIAAAGGNVILGYARNTDAAQALAQELGPRAIGLVQADFADRDAAAQVWAEAKKCAQGPIQGLVLNHGVFEPASVHDPLEAWTLNWSRTLQINLQSCADLARHAARDWVDSGRTGLLVAISSRAAQLRRLQGRADRPDQDAGPRLCRSGLAGLRHRAGLDRHGYGAAGPVRPARRCGGHSLRRHGQTRRDRRPDRLPVVRRLRQRHRRHL